MTTTVEILREAKAVLEHQGGLYDSAQAAAGTARDACRVCLVGAFSIAATGSPVGRSERSDAAWDAITRALEQRGPLSDSPIADWNDAEGRTVAEVYALLDEAIELASADDAGTLHDPAACGPCEDDADARRDADRAEQQLDGAL